MNIKSRIKKLTQTISFKIIMILIIFVLLILYGPYSGFRDWLITTSMTTMNHKWIAKLLYTDNMINKVLESNKIDEINENTNLDLIDGSVYIQDTDLEKEILQKDSTNQLYKTVKIKGDTYTGYIAAIYDSSKISTIVTKDIWRKGEYLVDMAKENDAVLAINGGGFCDNDENAGIPVDITFSNGNLITNNNYIESGGFIGFTKENKLMLGKYNVDELMNLNIRDGASFGPFLIVNGKTSTIYGNGGWGNAPRTAIGQRQDGIVLFLVLDGRKATRPGADMNDIIEIMQKCGAYNVANLDGGTSSAMVENGTIINDPIDSNGKHQTRPIATAFIVKN